MSQRASSAGHPPRVTRHAPLLTCALLLLCVLGAPGCDDEQAQGGFVVLLDTAPKGIDPRFATSDASVKLVGLLHAGLVSNDTATGKWELELAESIEQTAPTRYEITLRDGLTFHDGKPVTTADVEYTFMELGSETVKSPYAGISRRMDRFEVLDDRRIVITLKEPHAPFVTDLSLGIVPKHICAGHKECPGDPIGAGPFRFESQEGSNKVVFRAFDGYFGGTPPIDRLVFKVVKDDNTRLLALLGNSADLVQNAVAPLMLPVVEDDDRLEIERAPSFKYTYIAFNLEHDLLKDVRVRRALAHGIDREAIIRYKFRGYATKSTGLIAPNHWAYNPDVPTYDYDPERAMKLLDEAGYTDPDGPDGPEPRFEIEFKVSSNKFRKSMAELIAHQLARIGIRVTVRAYEWGTFFSDIKSRNFAMTTLQWPSVLEPSLYRWIFHSSNIPSEDNRSAGANRGAYRNPRVDELLEQGDRETDPERRIGIYHEVQRILAEDVPYISLWHEDNLAIMKRGHEGYYITPNARFEGLKSTVPRK